MIVDELAEDGFVGRTYSDAPEIDGVVMVHTNAELEVGDFVDVKITNSDEHDLYGELIDV